MEICGMELRHVPQAQEKERAGDLLPIKREVLRGQGGRVQCPGRVRAKGGAELLIKILLIPDSGIAFGDMDADLTPGFLRDFPPGVLQDFPAVQMGFLLVSPQGSLQHALSAHGVPDLPGDQPAKAQGTDLLRRQGVDAFPDPVRRG